MRKTTFFKSLLLLCALIVGGPAWAEDVTLTAGTNGSACKVNEKDGIKLGTSSKGGDMTITVPANTTKLTLYAAAWKSVTGLSLDISEATASPSSISLTADDGIASNSPFTLKGNEDNFKFEITLSGITSETKVKFATSTTKRCVIWGASATVSGSGSTKTATAVTISDNDTEAILYTVDTPKTPTATVKAGESAIEGAKVTWSSSNEEVAVIDENTGVITLKGIGITKIKADYAETDTYQSSSASYQLNVGGVFTTIKDMQDNVKSVSLPVKITFTNVHVTGVTGSNAYIADESDNGAIIYTYDHGLEVGQIINGTLEATFVLFNGMTEITGFKKDGLTITNGTIEPKVKTIGEITDANQGSLVTLENVTLVGSGSTIMVWDGESRIQYYDKFKVGTPTIGGTYTITGIVGIYNGTRQISPRSTSEIQTITIPVTASEKYSTFACTSTLNFSGTGITAYTAKVDGGVVKLTEITDGIVPAGAGVILKGDGTEVNVPGATTTATLSNNELVGVTTVTKVDWSAESKYNYILQNGKFRKATGANLKAGKAYLSTTYDVTAATGAARLDIVIDGETNAIANVRSQMEDVRGIFNLQGQRVEKAQKGLYIVNGKKILVK